MAYCKWMQSAICTNPDCMKGRYCPVPDYPGVCRHEDRRDEEEKSKMELAIEMIDDYLQEPNSISADWVAVLRLCRKVLREKVN